MKQSIPFLRFINNTDMMPNNDFTMAYDCRMLYVLEGKGIFYTESNNFLLEPETLIYYPSGFKYFPKSDSIDKLRFYTLNFDFTSDRENITETMPPVFCKDYVPDMEFPSYKYIKEDIFSRTFIIKDAIFLKSNIKRLNEIYKQGGEYSTELCSALLKLCILDIIRYFSHAAKANPLIEEIKHYIENNYSLITSNRDVATHFKYHEYYLNNLFKKHTGTTIHKHLIDTRIKNAQEMLLYTNESISNIAAKCGFINADHFSRIFKSKTGVSAKMFRSKTNNI